MKYPKLFQEGRIGKLTVKNRIVMAPMGTALCTMNGEMTDNIIEYYKTRAKGGFGLLFVEVSEVDWAVASATLNSVRVDTSRAIPQMRRLADGVHAYGAKIFGQLHHGGRQANRWCNDGNQPVSCSPIQSKACPDEPRELTNQEVKETIEKFIFGAQIMQMAGFDGCEIHAAHGYLVNQFISEYSNKRTDEYGGSFENRMRFCTEIIQGIKKRCGNDFPVSVRIDCEEGIEEGYGLETGIEVAKAVEAAGADVINCSMACYEAFPAGVDTASFKQGWRVYQADAVRKAVSIPVICVGAIRDPEFAEECIAQGKTDFVALGRQSIADPEWPNKARAGKDKEIRKCLSCMTCIYNLFGGGAISCAVNPRAGHEKEYIRPIKNGNGRTVVVVGGGPGGIEAARVLAIRGFAVTLFEKGEKLGGQLVFAKNAIDQENMENFADYGTEILHKLGVDVRLHTEAIAEPIRALTPYAVFLATGANGFKLKVPGYDLPHVYTAEEYLSGMVELKGKRIAVVGGGITGCETAALAASKGNQAALVEMLPSVCNNIYNDSRIEIINDLKKFGVEIMTSKAIQQVEKDGVIIKDVGTEESMKIPADTVIMALGVKPNRKLYNELAEEYENLYCFGDASAQGKIIDATRSAHVYALELDA